MHQCDVGNTHRQEHRGLIHPNRSALASIAYLQSDMVSCLQCRLLSPSRIYKQQYQSIANKTRLVAACLQIVNSNASLSYDAVVRHLADGVAMLPQGADPEAPEYISDFDGHDTAEVQRFGQHDLLDHAAFVVQQVGPVLGRHALKVRFAQPGIILGFSLNCCQKAYPFLFF